MQILMFDEFKAQLEQKIHESLRHLKSFNELGILDNSSFFNILSESILSSGKRIRPLLFLAAHEGYCRSSKYQEFCLDAAMDVAVTLELMHSFALIHDDLVDKSTSRRGRPSLQVAFDDLLKAKGSPSLTGTELAMIAGDIIYALAIENYSHIKIQPELKESALQELLQSAIKTGCGVFAEIYLRSAEKPLNCEQIFKLYQNKTTYYSFTCPLKMAAILANMPKEELKRVSDFSESIGLAYQIHDDINDLKKELNSGNGICDTQTKEIKTMLPFHYLYHKSKGNDQKWLSDLSLSTKASIDRFKSLLQNSNAIAQSQDKLNDYWEQAIIKLKLLELPEQMKDMLLSLFSKSLSLQMAGV